MNDARTRGLGGGVVGIDAAANKGNLTAEVNIVHAMARAGGNDVAAIQAVGADHGDKHLGTFHHALHSGGIIGGGDGDVPVRIEFIAQRG